MDGDGPKKAKSGLASLAALIKQQKEKKLQEGLSQAETSTKPNNEKTILTAALAGALAKKLAKKGAEEHETSLAVQTALKGMIEKVNDLKHKAIAKQMQEKISLKVQTAISSSDPVEQENAQKTIQLESSLL